MLRVVIARQLIAALWLQEQGLTMNLAALFLLLAPALLPLIT
jgi:hypothetical protein